MHLTEVGGLAAALDVARELQKSSTDLVFRGHCNARWSVLSSLVRAADQVGPKAAGEPVAKFLAWSSGVPGLARLDPEQRVAIAQHYGIPTPFTDWSRSPECAAFFACAGGDEHAAGRLYYVSIAEWGRFWEVARRAGIPPFDEHPEASVEAIEIHVPDLWRLQRQRGLFLEIPFAGVEALFPFDSIVFPYDATSTQYAEVMRPVLSPKEQSPVEQRLQEYVMSQRLDAIHESDEWKDLAGLFSDVIDTSRNRDGGRRIAVPLTVEVGTVRSAWFELPDEHADLTERPQTIQLDRHFVRSSGQDLDLGLLAQWLAHVIQALKPLDRMRPIVVNGEGDPLTDGSIGVFDRAATILEVAWNGMRWLLYSDEDMLWVAVTALLRFHHSVASPSLGNLEKVERAALRTHIQMATELDLRVPRQRTPADAPMELEFGRASVSAYQRGWCTAEGLDAIVTSQALRTNEHWLRLLERGWSPLDVFDFDGLLECWVWSILPSQLGYRSISPLGTSLVYFSPAWIDVLGQP